MKRACPKKTVQAGGYAIIGGGVNASPPGSGVRGQIDDCKITYSENK